MLNLYSTRSTGWLSLLGLLFWHSLERRLLKNITTVRIFTPKYFAISKRSPWFGRGFLANFSIKYLRCSSLNLTRTCLVFLNDGLETSAGPFMGFKAALEFSLFGALTAMKIGYFESIWISRPFSTMFTNKFSDVKTRPESARNLNVYKI